MTFAAPECWKRNCRWYEGLRDLEPIGEPSQVHVCPAFPKGIPSEITYGDNKHLTVHPDQVGEVVYEEAVVVENV